VKNLNKQKGIALLAFVSLLAMAATALFAKGLNDSSNSIQISRDKITAAALAQAKDALIGRAVADDNRPGSLPCPDNNDDGIADLFAGNNCPSYIGRLPWRTLGLPDINDGSRERLWYALSNNFRDHQSAQPINSDTKGTFTVYSTNLGLVNAQAQAVAIVFSPGNALPGQDRATANVTSNYLDQSGCPGASCRDNTSQHYPFGIFFMGPVLDDNRNTIFNDNLLLIEASDIIPSVEKRVAKELKDWLQAYYAANGYYPYPAKYNDCDSEHCRGNTSVCRGRIPMSAAPGDAAWSPPSWFVNNQWYREIYYSVGSGSVQNPASVTCNPTLTVTGTGAVRAVFFMPGSPMPAMTRPSNTLGRYLEDAENQDGWSVGANDTYINPSATMQDRDRLISLP